MKVMDFVNREIQTVSPWATVREATERMRAAGTGFLPVCEADGQLVGVLTDRDVAVRAVAEGRDVDETTVRDVMTEEAVCCYEHVSAAEALELMTDEGVRRLVVVDRANRFVGVATLEDPESFADAGGSGPPAGLLAVSWTAPAA